MVVLMRGLNEQMAFQRIIEYSRRLTYGSVRVTVSKGGSDGSREDGKRASLRNSSKQETGA